MKKRIVIIALVVALLATCFAGTFAYLTDSESQKNTFTAGNVYITLDEAAVVKDDATGNWVKDGNNRVTAVKDQVNGNSYHLFPGTTAVKDPTITVDEESEDAWVAAKITFSGYYAYELLSGGVLGTNAVTEVKDGNVVYVYVNAIQSADASPIVLFEKLTVPAEWNNTEMAAINGMTIDVEAFAVQANGFATCQAAMAAAFHDVFPANN